MASRTVTLESDVSMRDSGRVPTYSLRLLTTISASVFFGKSLRRRR